MFLSDFAEINFLNTMRNIAFAAPSQVYCGLFLTSPGETGTSGIEMAYPGYARVPIVFSPPTAEGTGIGIRNTQQIDFAQSPTDVGTVRHIGIFDAVTGGNMYMFGELTEGLPVMAGESPVLLLNEVLFFSIGHLSTIYKTRLFNILRGTSLPGVNPFFALWNGNPQSGGSELVGDNYQRVPLTFSAPVSDAGGQSIIRNSNTVNFNRPTTNWGNWNFSAIMSAETTGEPIWIQERTPAKVLSRGIMPIIEADAITVGIN